MSKTKSKHSVSAVYRKYVSKRTGATRWILVGYLSARDEENGLDSRYDMQGYKIVAL